MPRPQCGHNEAHIDEVKGPGREPSRTRDSPGTVQGAREALEEKSSSDGTAEEELTAERRLDAPRSSTA